MPSFPIVDTHVHLWDPAQFPIPWMDGVPRLKRPYLVADYDTARGPVEVDKIVFLEVDAAPPSRLDEARWVAGLAAAEPRLQGMVAAAPLESGAGVEDHLAQLAEHGILRGIRRLIQNEPDVAFCVQPDFVAGVQLLAKFGLSFDICIYHPQAANAVELVRQCPDVEFILDHIGKPAIKDGLMDPWRRDITALAALPNVHCKISGMVTEADHANWTRDDLRPYFDHVIGAFGFDRVIYGGDWPVATLATDYPRWVETVEWAVAGCSDDELRKLFRDNAIRFYRLG